MWAQHRRHHHGERRGPWGAAGPFGPGAAWGHGGSWGPGRGALFRDGPAAFVRARLHRRIFAWFGISILFTGIALGTLSAFFEGRSGFGYRHQIDGANNVMTGAATKLAKVWDRPEERARLARDMGRSLDARVELRDAAGAPLDAPAEPCRRASIQAKVTSAAGVELGEVRLCMDSRPAAPRWGGLAIVVACVMLWAASGRIAVRLARPLGDLARVAQDLGRGKLDSRVDIGCYGHGEVGVVAEAMNDMAARIQKQLDDQRELLATVSHELRTPLSRIRLLTEIARDGGDPAHAFDEIDREVVEIDRLVGDLLASSRLDFSALTTKEISAAEAARRAASRAGLAPDTVMIAGADGAVKDRDADGAAEGSAAEAKDAEDAKSDGEAKAGPRLAADPTLLARALSNLLDNAASHGGGAKRLVVRNGGDTVAFEVEDNGPGLAPREEDRIFEPFYQGSSGAAGAADEGGAAGDGSTNGTKKKGALGLGLALVRRIAEAHGGRAYAENRAEGGARFVLELPVHQPAEAPAPASFG
jgi:signal transduction histidine kinase